MNAIQGQSGRTVDVAASAELLGESSAIRRLRDLVGAAAAGRRGVLLLAEPGSQGEAVARAIHAAGERRDAPFVRVDCATPEPLAVERELFGDSGGRPNGRANGHGPVESVSSLGALAAVRAGTLYLDNLAEMPAPVQSRLARLARDGQMKVSGALRPFTARLVACAPPNVNDEVEQGRLRSDLFRRLAATPIALPPLRDRSEDIPLLAAELARVRSAALGLTPKMFTQSALLVLKALPWRRNLAELEEVVDRVVTAAPGTTIRLEDVLGHVRLEGPAAVFAPGGNLREARLRFERDYIAAVLRHHRWRMSDAARALGIQRTNLYRKARQLGITRERL